MRRTQLVETTAPTGVNSLTVLEDLALRHLAVSVAIRELLLTARLTTVILQTVSFGLPALRRRPLLTRSSNRPTPPTQPGSAFAPPMLLT